MSTNFRTKIKDNTVLRFIRLFFGLITGHDHQASVERRRPRRPWTSHNFLDNWRPRTSSHILVPVLVLVPDVFVRKKFQKLSYRDKILPNQGNLFLIPIHFLSADSSTNHNLLNGANIFLRNSSLWNHRLRVKQTSVPG